MRHFLAKLSLGTISALCLMGISSTSVGYFEDRLLCDTTTDTVTVRIDTQGPVGESQYCFEILQRTARKIQSNQADRTRAQGYLDEAQGDDVVYRQGVIESLQQDVVPYETLRDLVVRAMRDYELQLFISTKGLVASYLRDEYEDLTIRYEQALELKDRIVLLGNQQQFAFVLEKIQQREQQLMILRTIRQATTFERLMPALRIYFAQQGPAL